MDAVKGCVLATFSFFWRIKAACNRLVHLNSLNIIEFLGL